MAKVVVNGREYDLPGEDDMTLGEIADIEDICGQGYDPGNAGGKMMVAMTYIAMRRKDKTVTLDDVRAIQITHVETVDDEDEPEEADPTDVAANGDSSAAETGSLVTTGSPS